MSKLLPAHRPASASPKPKAERLTVYILASRKGSVLAHVASAYQGLEIVQGRDPETLAELMWVRQKTEGRRSMVMIVDTFSRPSTMNLVSASMDRHVPVLIGPAAKLPTEMWRMKSEALMRGLIFEIASNTDYPARVDSMIRAVTSSSVASSLKKWLDTTQASEHAEVMEFVTGKATDTSGEEVFSLPGVTAATRLLRSESGRLHAERIKDVFGLNRSELAEMIGATAESIRQTPDSKKIQTELLHFERIAGLLSLVKEPDQFRKWLNAPNPELDGRHPLSLMVERSWSVIENLVADILENRGR